MAAITKEMIEKWTHPGFHDKLLTADALREHGRIEAAAKDRDLGASVGLTDAWADTREIGLVVDNEAVTLGSEGPVCPIV